MSTGHKPPYSDAQRREAAELFVEIQACTEPDSDALHAWLRWMESADGNRLAFEAIVLAWYSTPDPLMVALPSAEELADDSYDGSVSLTSWKETPAPPESDKSVAATRPQVRTRRRTWPYVAIGVAASVTAVVIGALQIRDSRPAGDGEYVTKTAERLDISLSDGSHISLGGKSRLYVAFTKDRRNVHLEAGEGYFTVAKDLARPFVVHALTTDVTAVGTAFDVRAVAEQVTIAVSEGVVKVRPPTSTSTTSAFADVRVIAGQQLALDASGVAHAVTVLPAGPAQHSDWRSGVLVYRNEPLRAVVADVTRYTDLRIEVAAGATGDLRFSGTVHSDAIAEWAAALPESFPVRLIPSGDGLTIVEK